jgi:myo-inositol-1(or 4)-monophosphatase
MSVHPLINVATRAARSASRVLFRSFDKLEDNLLTPVRRRALAQRIQNDVARELTEQIQGLYPDHALSNAHEGTKVDTPLAEHRWIIGAVDATENLRRGLPHFAITLAYQLNGETTVGLIHNPIQDETFSAVTGQGALLNQKRIRTNKNVKALSGAIFAGCNNQNTPGMQETINPIANAIALKTAGSYSSGSNALDIVYTACGRLDGFWNLSATPHDLSAALLIAKEAGALTTSLKGEEAFGLSNDLLVCHPKLHEQMLAVIRG